jgi:hypothetical protein
MRKKVNKSKRNWSKRPKEQQIETFEAKIIKDLGFNHILSKITITAEDQDSVDLVTYLAANSTYTSLAALYTLYRVASVRIEYTPKYAVVPTSTDAFIGTMGVAFGADSGDIGLSGVTALPNSVVFNCTTPFYRTYTNKLYKFFRVDHINEGSDDAKVDLFLAPVILGTTSNNYLSTLKIVMVIQFKQRRA